MIISSFTHPRWNETFNIYLDEDDDLSFIGVERFIGNIGGDPIRYESLQEIPQPHRHEVEQKIHEIKKARRK